MRVAYLDIGDPLTEDYSISPHSYGAVALPMRYLKQYNNFHIFSKEAAFRFLEPYEKKSNCHIINEEQYTKIINFERIDEAIPEIVDFDLLIHHHAGMYWNTDNILKQATWVVGPDVFASQQHKYILYFDDNQVIHPPCHPNLKKYKFVLGREIPNYFSPIQKDNYMFQATRHYSLFGSNEVALFAKKHKIKCYFAGRIMENYSLAQHIDNINTFYLGEIPEEDKLFLTSRARLYPLLINKTMVMNFSMVEAMSYGTPVVATPNGIFNKVIKHDKNGFFATHEEQLLYAWENAHKIDPMECYNSIVKYNHFNMIETFYQACLDICND